jgi:iron complex outermembrane receptor protein
MLVLISTIPALGQTNGQVQGRITDETGALIIGATVQLSHRTGLLRLSSISDDAGAYRFAGLTPGEYLLEVRKEGFRTTVRSIRVESQTQSVDLTLPVAGVDEEIVVLASGRPQSSDEVSKATTEISREEIERRDEYSLAETLRNTPGLRVQQLAGPGSFTTFQFRGLRSPDSSLVIDQLRLRDAADVNGSINGYAQDLLTDNYERVEILRGSASSLYGTNAIGGIINLVPRQEGGPMRGDVLLEGGSLQFLRGRLNTVGGLAQDRFLYSFGATHINVGDGVDGQDAYRNTTLTGRGQYNFAPNVAVIGRLWSTDAFGQLNETPAPVPTLPPLPRGQNVYKAIPLGQPGATFIPDLNDPDSRRELDLVVGAVRFSHQVNDRWGYTLAYQGTDSRRRNANGPGQDKILRELSVTDSASRSRFDGRIHNFDLRHDLKLGSHVQATVGYEFEREQFFSLSQPNITVDTTQRSQAFFFHDQVRFLENRLQFGAAFRVQDFDLKSAVFGGGAVSPYPRELSRLDVPTAVTGDGAISYYFVSTGTKVRAHLGNGFRAPSAFERFGNSFFFGSFSFFGDPTLRPERSLSVDAGVDQDFAGGRARVSATYFYTRLQEVIVFPSFRNGDPKGFGRFFGYANGGGGLARGVEVSTYLSPIRSLDLYAAYTFTNSDEVTPTASGTTRVFGLPDHQFSFQANQRLGRFNINFDLTALGNHDFPLFASFSPFPSGVFRFDGYVKADLAGSYTIPLSERLSLQLFGKVDNVFDRKYFEEGFRAPGAVGLGGAKIQF